MDILRVLGLDDWAWRRSQRYGSILVDLERRRPVDLLPDRSAAGVATWLCEHPGVEVVSRDRAGAYAEGVRQGAPDAVQVADRWHLLVNIGEMLERVVGSHRIALQQGAAAVDRMLDEATPPGAGTPVAELTESPRQTRLQQVRQARRAHRLARYEAVVALHQEGFSQVAISKRLGLGRKTIRRYLRADAFPDQAGPGSRPTILAPYDGYLRSRWAEGCHNAFQLWHEIRRQGFPGQAALVRRYVARWRPQPGRPGRAARRSSTPDGSATPPPRPPTRVLSPHQARWLLLRRWDLLTPEEQTYRAFLLDEYPVIREAQRLADDFGELIRTRNVSDLAAWLDRAEGSARPEIHAVGLGLRRDQAAVEAALSSPWSNGQTEGQVNKLKLLKRQMYGRASFQLLRQRFLLTA
jgi:transposase